MNLYLFVSLISLLCLALQFPPLNSLSAWVLPAIEQGQWWRILTGNFTHTNFAHLTMNLAAFWIIATLFRPGWRSLLVLLLAIGAIIGITCLFTNMYSYVGLSGVLHGIFAYYALQELLQGRKASALLIAGLVGKITWEQCFGGSASTAALIGASIATGAHLTGAISGMLGAIGYHWLQKKKAQSSAP